MLYACEKRNWLAPGDWGTRQGSKKRWSIVSSRALVYIIQMNGILQGKVVVLTGATGGIGKASALLFAGEGAKLLLIGRRQDLLEQVCSEVRVSGAEVIMFVGDITRPGVAEAAIEKAEKSLGPVDVLLCCAGQYLRRHASLVDAAVLEDSMNVNFWGTAKFVCLLLPKMLARGAGHIIAVSSVDGKKGLPLDTPYVAAKYAVTGMLDSMRQDVRGTGVHVSTILPGRVDTPMIGDLTAPWISPKISAQRVAKTIVRVVKRGRGGEVIVPWLGPKTLLVAAGFSIRLADFLIRLFRLEGNSSRTFPGRTQGL